MNGAFLNNSSVKYGYSNTRAKGMRSLLLNKSQISPLLNSKNTESILSFLMQTDYSKALSEFGGVNIKNSIIDFALSKNLAEKINTIMRITPHSDRAIMRSIIGRWDLHNIKLALEAKENNISYERISKYIIDYGEYNHLVLKEVLKEDNIERMLQRLIKNSSYANILQKAEKAYSEHKKVSNAIAAIDLAYYNSLEHTMHLLYNRSERAGRIVRMEIDSRNILTAIRAKSRKSEFSSFQKLLINGGSLSIDELKKLYGSSDSVESLASKITIFDLKEPIQQYKKNKRMLVFEVAMRNRFLVVARKAISQSVLCITSIISYVYLKEIEVSTLRILIKGKEYGLSGEELSELMIWKEN